jgi:hypothetical protein
MPQFAPDPLRSIRTFAQEHPETVSFGLFSSRAAIRPVIEGLATGDHKPRSALHPEILCRRLSLIRDFFVFDDLALIQSAETGPLDRRDMDKHIFSAPTLRLNESVALRRVEPLHGAFSHFQQSPHVDVLTISSGRRDANLRLDRPATPPRMQAQ